MRGVIGLALVCSSLTACSAPRRAADAGGIDAAIPDAVIVLPDGATERADVGPQDDSAVVPGEDAAVTPADAGGADFPYCQKTCTAPADCAAGTPLYDASHYACDAGVCRWLGCVTDAECQGTFGSTAYACRDFGGLSQCMMTCSAPADCATSPAFDADNYACEGGICRYLGCHTDDECTGSFSSSAYVCRAVRPPNVGIPIPTADTNCVMGCSVPGDCATSAAFDGDNYECVDGACIYTGCNDDGECRASFGSSIYACR